MSQATAHRVTLACTSKAQHTRQNFNLLSQLLLSLFNLCHRLQFTASTIHTTHSNCFMDVDIKMLLGEAIDDCIDDTF